MAAVRIWRVGREPRWNNAYVGGVEKEGVEARRGEQTGKRAAREEEAVVEEEEGDDVKGGGSP